MSRYVKSIVFPFFTALIWGIAFVFQGDAAQVIEPFTFNTTRSAVAFVTLCVLLLGREFLRHRLPKKEPLSEETEAKERPLDRWFGGFCCGTALTAASFFQQFGLGDTSPGKSAFITALYVVLVPVFGLFLRKKVPAMLWISVGVAVAGLYFLCVDEKLRLSDGMLLIGACCYAVHILTVDHFSSRVDGFRLSCIQFLTMTVESGIFMALFEKPDVATILSCLWPILYVGIFSSGVAYTLQILAQSNSNPTVVSLVLCLESVFAVLAQTVMRSQWLRPKELLGCMLMLLAIVGAQLPASVWQKVFRKQNKKA